MKSLIVEIKNYLGNIDFDINYIDSIKKTNSNKLRFVVSDLKD